MRVSITFLPILMAITLSIFGLALFYTVHLNITRNQLIDNELHHLETELLEQLTSLQLHLMRNDHASLKNWTSLKSENPHVKAVLIVSPEQQIIAAHKIELEGKQLHDFSPSITLQISTLQPKSMLDTIQLQTTEADELLLTIPLQFRTATGWMLLQYDLKPALTAGLTITLENMLIYLFSMFLSGSLTYVCLKRVLHTRLRQIEHTLQQYSVGQHNARAVLSNTHEFGRLELMLNQTFDALDQQRQASQHSQLFNELILNSTTDGIISASTDGRILRVNHAALQIFGYDHAEELTGQNLHLLVPTQYRQMHQLHLLERGKMPPQSSHVLNQLRQVEGLRKDGTLVPVAITITQAQLEGESIYIAFLKDNTEQRHYQKSIEQLAFTDAMTGSVNLNGLKRLLTPPSTLQWIYLLNIDGMANLNSSFGFETGDTLIKACYSLLLQALPATAVLARDQGAEFIVLSEIAPTTMLPQLADLQGSELRLSGFTVKLSFCLTYQPLDLSTAFEPQLHSTELMMRHAKAAGRGSALPVDPKLIQQLQHNALLCHDLEKAIRDEALFFHYQPKFAALSRQPVSAEALIRWRRDDQFISPAIFIPLAEQSHLMPQLDRLVIRLACRQIRHWLDLGLAVMPMSINLSARYLVDDETIAYIFEKVGEFGIPSSLLEVEVTEYSLIEDDAHTAENMLRLQRAGISIAIDDYGTGHSNLATVLSLPVQNLKIDQSFIRQGMGSKKGRAILENILLLAKSLEVSTTAEGVETEEQLQFLQDSGCNYIQGYLLSKPLPQAEFEQLMEQTGT